MIEELDLQGIISVIRTHKLFIFVFTMFAVFVGVIYIIFFQKPMYEANTNLVLTMVLGDNDNASITQNDVTLNQKLVGTYSEIIKSRKVASQVISDLNLPISESNLVGMITVSSKTNTEMININVKNSDPYIASSIANKVAEIFSKEIVNIYNIKNIAVIDIAEQNSKPYNINIVREIAIFIVLGLFISFCILFIIYILDTTVKNKEELESKLGIPVLVVIPFDNYNK